MSNRVRTGVTKRNGSGEGPGISAGYSPAIRHLPRKPPFQPYSFHRHEDGRVELRENTFGEEVRERFLRGSVLWLLGYDARIPLVEQLNDSPIRTCAMGSSWLLGRNISDLIRIRSVFAPSEPLVAEIDRKLLVKHWGGVDQLIKYHNPRGAPIGHHWEQRIYDTAAAVDALIRVAECYRQMLSEARYAEIQQLITGGLQWLMSELVIPSEALDANRPWSATLRALASAVVSSLPGIRHDGLQRTFVNAVEDANLYLQREKIEEKLAREMDGAEQMTDVLLDTSVLCELARIVTLAGPHLPPQLLVDVRQTLTRALEATQTGFERWRFWAAPDNKSRFLEAYIAMSEATHGDLIDERIPVQVLAEIVGDRSSIYEDGSAYQDIYTTTFYMNGLLALANSPISRKSIPEIYDLFMQTTPLRVAEVQRKNFERERRIYDQDLKLAQQAEKISHLRGQLRRFQVAFLTTAGLLLWVLVCWQLATWLNLISISLMVNDANSAIALAALGSFAVAGFVYFMFLFLRDEV